MYVYITIHVYTEHMYFGEMCACMCESLCGTNKTYMHVYKFLSKIIRVRVRSRACAFLFSCVAMDRHLRVSWIVVRRLKFLRRLKTAS